MNAFGWGILGSSNIYTAHASNSTINGHQTELKLYFDIE